MLEIITDQAFGNWRKDLLISAGTPVHQLWVGERGKKDDFRRV